MVISGAVVVERAALTVYEKGCVTRLRVYDVGSVSTCLTVCVYVVDRILVRILVINDTCYVVDRFVTFDEDLLLVGFGDLLKQNELSATIHECVFLYREILGDGYGIVEECAYEGVRLDCGHLELELVKAAVRLSGCSLGSLGYVGLLCLKRACGNEILLDSGENGILTSEDERPGVIYSAAFFTHRVDLIERVVLRAVDRIAFFYSDALKSGCAVECGSTDFGDTCGNVK